MDRIGLIAGNGRFPFLVAEEILKNGDELVIIALKEEADPSIEKFPCKTFWVNLGQFQKLFDIFHEEKISKVIMAGQVKHTQLFAGLKLDWRAIKLLGKLINKKTDTILGAVADEFLKEGVQLLPSHLYLKKLMPQPGLLCGTKLNKEEKADVEFGYKIAKQIAGMDIGQSVVVKDCSVVAVESAEGTDECIKRAAGLAGENTIVVKVAKPNQDWRFDVPVIGVKTINVMADCKVRALAVDAGATLMIDKDEMLKAAKEKNVTIIAQ